MGFLKDRRVVTALAVFVVAAFVARVVSFRVVMLGAVAVVGFLSVRWLLRSGTALARARAPLQKIELLPPPERYRHRTPTTQEALVRALQHARLGELRLEGAALVVDGGRAGKCRVSLAKGEDVVLNDLTVEATSTDFGLMTCDALAPVVGPFTFRAEGLELFIDGTTPLVELQRQLHDLRMMGPRPKPLPPPGRSDGGGYLH